MGKPRIALEILWAYVVIRWSLHRSGVTVTLDSARRRPRASVARDDASSQELALRLGRGVQRTLGMGPLDSRCLIRSLVLTRLLARRGVASTVVFAARSKPRFMAHSWVEHRGVPLLPTGDGFHRLKEL